MVIKKYYLLAVMMMAGNMLVVNEVRASEEENKKTKTLIEEALSHSPCKYIGFLVQWENTLNLVGGALFHLSNRHYNFYKDKPSFYFDIWCAGWNLKPCAKGYLQFCPNINFVRGILWLIITILQFKLLNPLNKKDITEQVKGKLGLGEYGQLDKETEAKIENRLVHFLPYSFYVLSRRLSIMFKNENEKKQNKRITFFTFIFKILLQDFLSIPLIIHFSSKFSISIAIDSIIWMGASYLIEKKNEKDKTIEIVKERKKLNRDEEETD